MTEVTGRDMHRRLGEILVDAAVVDAQQLRAALAEAARHGRRVGEVLVARGLCTEQAIVDALASQLQVAVAPLATTTFIPEHVLGMVAPHFARERQVLPLFLDRRAGALDVAIADPTDDELLDELRFRTGQEIRPLVALAGELADAIEEFYFRRADEDDVAFEHETPPPKMQRPAPPEVYVEAPEDDPDPAADLYQHPVSAGGAKPSEPPPRQRTVQVRVERTAPRPDPVTAPLADVPSDEWGDDHSTLGEAAAQAPEGETLDALRQRVVHLEGRVAELYGILREAAAAHQTLLGLLAERGLVERESFRAAVQARLDGRKRRK
jgi:hypothetical protein